MNAKHIPDESLAKLTATLSEEQRKIVTDGLRELESSDPQQLQNLLESDKKFAACGCGPSGEPGLTQW